MKIESRTGKVMKPSEKIYKFIADFRNYADVIPQEKVSNWNSSEDSCEFTMDMLGKVKLDILEKEPFKLVKIGSAPDVSQYNFTLWIQIKQLALNDSRIKITIEPRINQVLLGMIKKPLTEFVNSLVDKIEDFQFNE